eukprot:TRINITY_DN67135_c1_g2_i1.p1 TRINITY_DN67135_c1_g2~~TRINITY_DN67135_c1_g2_i1.p1  ORF type:complete len:597 (+),score=43.69 TRINITY_DN67135_c1_g2_i1:59-1849(+)
MEQPENDNNTPNKTDKQREELEWAEQAAAVAELESYDDFSFLEEFKENLTWFSEKSPDKQGSLQNALQKRLDALYGSGVTVGISGRSGMGKTTFLNTLRGLRPTDRGAAAVGVTETTLAVQKYEFPGLSNISLCDLPGVGTERFPRETYLDQVNFSTYDIIIVVSKDRFTSDDLWLIEQAKSMSKPFFFIRSHVDRAVEDNLADNGVAEADTLLHIRRDCEQQLCHTCSDIPKRVFLLSGRFDHQEMFDFPALKDTLCEDLPRFKQHLLTLALGGYSKKLIGAKTAQLKKTIPVYAAAAGGGSAVPIPGTGIAVDLAVLGVASKRFAKGLNVTTESIDIGRAVPAQVQAVITAAGREVGEQALKKIIARYATTGAAQAASKFVPFVGPVVAGTVGFTITFYTLSTVLSRLQKHAEELGPQLGQVLVTRQMSLNATELGIQRALAKQDQKAITAKPSTPTPEGGLVVVSGESATGGGRGESSEPVRVTSATLRDFGEKTGLAIKEFAEKIPQEVATATGQTGQAIKDFATQIPQKVTQGVTGIPQGVKDTTGKMVDGLRKLRRSYSGAEESPSPSPSPEDEEAKTPAPTETAKATAN